MLTFSSGKYYIGKSLDLETRWKQHFNKFATGKAARPMQLEYDRCGLPETQVIFNCHRDHIDILEELLIDQFKGPDMLNTTYPQVNPTDESNALINKSHDLLHLSTLEHLELLHGCEDKIAHAKNQTQQAMQLVQEFRTSGYIIPEDYEIMSEEVECSRETIELLESQTQQQQTELYRLKNLSWWDRLWNYSVYV